MTMVDLEKFPASVLLFEDTYDEVLALCKNKAEKSVMVNNLVADHKENDLNERSSAVLHVEDVDPEIHAKFSLDMKAAYDALSVNERPSTLRAYLLDSSAAVVLKAVDEIANDDKSAEPKCDLALATFFAAFVADKGKVYDIETAELVSGVKPDVIFLTGVGEEGADILKTKTILMAGVVYQEKKGA